MPRLTNTRYLYQRGRLRANWIDQQSRAFGRLESQEQMDLHDFFAPTEQFDDEAALRHRSEVTKNFPSLPQKAGRAYRSALPSDGAQRISPVLLVEAPQVAGLG